MRGPEASRRWERRLLAPFGILALLTLPGLLIVAPSAGSAAHPGQVGGLTQLQIPRLRDQSTLAHTFGLGISWISDNETTPPTPSRIRTYSISVGTTWANASQPLLILTTPTSFWADPNQMPYGADNLPPLSEWSWWVSTASGANDTLNWTVDPTGTQLVRPGLWVNQSYVVFGVTHPTIYVNVTPTVPDGTRSTGGGFVLNAPGYANNLPYGSTYASMASSLSPTIIRVGTDGVNLFTGWNSSSGQPILSFGAFDREVQFIQGTGASVVLSLPAGNWGDGNNAPRGTPLQLLVPEVFHNLSGYFIAPRAGYALARQIVNHTIAMNESIAYWSVGNEPPINSTLAAGAMAKAVNGVIAGVHVSDPKGLVGADNMMSTAYLSFFAHAAPKVGFLSFHWYQSWGLCENQTGGYCPPVHAPYGTPLPTLFAHPAYMSDPSEYPPNQAQSAWFNITGNWLPVFNTETNVGARGGPGSPTQAFGTDPRIPDLMGAAWLGSELVDSSRENLSALTYFSLTSAANNTATTTFARGGFGFGMTNITPAGAITKFSTFYVMQLWDQFLPAGSKGLNVTDTDSGSVRAYAVFSGGHVDVALVCRVGVPLTIRLNIAGHFTVRQISTLDSDSYSEHYNASANRTTVVRSGINQVYNPSSSTVLLPGYGFAIAQFSPSGITGAGSGNGSNNSTGSSGTGSIGLGSGGHSGTAGSGGYGSLSGSLPTSTSGAGTPGSHGARPTGPGARGTPTGGATGSSASAAAARGRDGILGELTLSAVGLLAVMATVAVIAGRSGRRPPRT